ncbi:peptidase S24-like family protein [Mycobacterium ulcerans str. Harvey]|uniref:Peptidase S24-like family protein n=1 Tax=Mycobacterium ulcerans str. Harvey TaxID=1299332 RepID=A0ABN0R062_MYCUL|nr:peptidase S24-like family protein [Mycobacterium ulcerans str. Harvey]
MIYYVMLTFVARPYLIPSESMEPTLHGCSTCVGDRIMVDKLTYRFTSPKPGDVIVFKGPPSWNVGYKSIRSSNTALRWVQNALSFIGFVPRTRTIWSNASSRWADRPSNAAPTPG